MPIPTFDRLMLPYLSVIRNGQEHSVKEVRQSLAEEFHLTESEMNEMLPSGKVPKFDSRVHFARLYLKNGRCLEAPGRGRVRITSRGITALRDNPNEIIAYLKRYSEFLEFIGVNHQDNSSDQREPVTITPDETLGSSYQTLRRALAQELLERIKNCPPDFFERLVVDLLVRMGYGGSREDAGQAIGKSGDGGVDGIIKEDRLGLDVIYIQAKRWEGTVERPTVQAFAGSLEGLRARKGVLITTSDFSKGARDYVDRIEKKIVLIDKNQLTELMIEYGVGVTVAETYVIKKIDLDYFVDIVDE